MIVLGKGLLIVVFLFLVAVQSARADNFLGIDNPPTSWGYHGKPENLQRWPQPFLRAVEAEQAKILLSVKDQRNWSLTRKMSGATNLADKEAILALDEKIRTRQIARDEAKGLARLWHKLEDGINAVTDPLINIFQKQPNDSFFSASDTIHGPRDCDIPDKQGPQDDIIIRRADFRLEGLFSQEEEKAGEKSTDYDFSANFLLTRWNCHEKSPSPTTKATDIRIDWKILEQKSQVAVANFFDETFNNNLKAKYNIDIQRGDEVFKKLDEAVKPAAETPSCTLTDASGDHIDFITGSNGAIASSDLRFARITKTGDLLNIYIEAAGPIPALDENSSQAYEIGFDRGGGGSNPLTPRNGADILYVVDFAKEGIRGFKETPGNQQNWQPLNAKKSASSVQFSLPLKEISQDGSVPPLRIYASSAIGQKIEFDLMENGGMKKCF